MQLIAPINILTVAPFNQTQINVNIEYKGFSFLLFDPPWSMLTPNLEWSTLMGQKLNLSVIPNLLAILK